MDELERELRSTFDRIADGVEPSDALVERTVVRSVHIRRQRRVLAASGFAAIALVVTIVAASIAGAGTGRHVQVTGPSFTALVGLSTSTSTTTTSAPLVTTTTVRVHRARPGSVTTVAPPGPTIAPTDTTVPPACATAAVDDGTGHGTFTLLANGDIRVVYGYVNNPSVAFAQYELDDGRGSTGGFTRVYTPDAFGAHWYDEWPTLGTDVRSCRQRHNFVVDPATATPDPTPTSTTAPAVTTIPDTTTVPETTTSAP